MITKVWSAIIMMILSYWLLYADFSDLSKWSDYYDSISYVQKEWFVEGYPDWTFKEGNKINRAEFTKILVATP